MGSAAIRTKLALRMANASACSARMRSLTLAIRAATVSTRPLIASARRGAAEDTSGMDATRISSSWLSRSMCAVRSVCASAQDATFLAHSRTAGASTRCTPGGDVAGQRGGARASGGGAWKHGGDGGR